MPLPGTLDSKKLHKLPTMYRLPKLHKRPYKARFIASSSSCTTTELSKLLTSCLTDVKFRVLRYYETVYERSRKIYLRQKVTLHFSVPNISTLILILSKLNIAISSQHMPIHKKTTYASERIFELPVLSLETQNQYFLTKSRRDRNFKHAS